MATSELNNFVSLVFLAGLGTAFLIAWLPGRAIRVGGRTIRVNRQDVRWLTVIPLAVCFASIAGGYIVQAWSGSWTTGDWRGSGWFVALMGLIMFVGAPLMVVGAVIHGWRSRRGKA
jgi:heme A synthase